jgi:hypothetical protein
MLRDGEPSPWQEAARNIATVRATPEHFKSHEARWKHDVKGYIHRAANERQGEADDTAGVGGMTPTPRAAPPPPLSASNCGHGPRLRAPRYRLLRAAQHGTCFRTSPA